MVSTASATHRPAWWEIALPVIAFGVPFGFAMPIVAGVPFWFLSWIFAAHLLLTHLPRLRDLIWPLKLEIFYFSTLVLILALYYPVVSSYNVEQSVKNYGVLEVNEPRLFRWVETEKQYTPPILELGDTGSSFAWGGPRGTPLFGVAWDSSLTIDKDEYGHPLFSTAVRDDRGNMILYMDKNRWEVSSDRTVVWDKNYNTNTLEILDRGGHVIFQVRMLKDRTQLLGDWFVPCGKDGQKRCRFGFRNAPSASGGALMGYTPIGEPYRQIEPIFCYPSQLHWGKSVDTNRFYKSSSEKQAKQYREDLVHVEAAIRILRPGIDIPPIVRKRIEFRPRYFKRGQLSRLLLDWIRQRGAEPFTVSDVLPVAIGEREMNHRDQEILRTSIHTVLNKLAKRGTVARMPAEGRTVRWKLAGEA